MNRHALQAEKERLEAVYAAQMASIQAQLDALPKERVRLRADAKGARWFYVYAGDDSEGQYISTVCGGDCARHNIDPAALAAHICRFGEPDVTREHEALEVAVRAWYGEYAHHKVEHFTTPAQCMIQALAALDAVKEPSCSTCGNKGKINGLSQETYCEQCVFSDRWKKNYYTPNEVK